MHTKEQVISQDPKVPQIKVSDEEVERLLATPSDEFMDPDLLEKVLLNIDNDMESPRERDDESIVLSILEQNIVDNDCDLIPAFDFKIYN